MIQAKTHVFWFVTGSQHLYGEEAVQEVEEHSKMICNGLNDGDLRFQVEYKAVATSLDGVRKLFEEATGTKSAQASSPGCIRFHRPKCGFPAFPS